MYQQDLSDATLFCHCLSFGRPIARRELEGLCPRSQYLLLSQKWDEESNGRRYRPAPSQPVLRESEIHKSFVQAAASQEYAVLPRVSVCSKVDESGD